MKHALHRSAIAAALLSVVWFIHWTTAAGLGFTDWGDQDYYQLLVRGFRKGHLHLDKAPPPELIALADPYDPAQNAPHRLPDASYFKGRYYLYFGPTPAITLMWPFVAVTGRELPAGAAIFVYCSVGFVAGSGLWLAIRRRYFPSSAAWIGVVGVLAFGLGTHVLSLPQRPMWWELAIAGGFAFSMLALVAVYWAIHGNRPALAMACAGLCLGLAGASRPPCFFGAAMLLPPLWLKWRQTGFTALWWRMAVAAGIALGACIAALLAYNHARFGNSLEFGQSYQLSGHHGKLDLFSVRFIPHNLGAYFFNAPNWTWEFPFLQAKASATNIAGYYGAEEVAGLGVTCVFLWFTLALPLAGRKHEAGETRALGATLAAIAAVGLGVGALICSMFSNTSRYAVDFMPAVGLLALCGLLGFERWLRERTRVSQVMAWPVIGSAFVVTLVMGVLISLDYHGRSLSRTNAPLWEPMERKAADALSSLGVRFGALPGAREIKVRFKPRPAGTVETFWQAADPRAAERIVIEHAGERELRFGYARGAAPVRWGPSEIWKPGHTHTIRLQLPSLYGPPVGWMSGLRRTLEFRERSSLGLSFSGSQSFGEVVPPFPHETEGGGAVPGDFSGDVRRIRVRPFDEQEFLGREPPAIECRTDSKPGGTLWMKVLLADRLDPKGEPLLAGGALYGSDMVFVREAGAGATKVLFEHYGQPPHESKPLVLDRTREHVFEINWPSLAVDRFGVNQEGEVWVRVNGEEVLRVRSAVYDFPPQHPLAGKNPFGTTCAPEFRGWVSGVRWQ